MLNQTQERIQAFVAVALLSKNGQSGQFDQLLSFLDPSEREQCEALYTEFQQEQDLKKRNKNLIRSLRQLQQLDEKVAFSDVHPSWYPELLKEEAPIIIKWILADLSPELRDYVLAELPEALKKQILNLKLRKQISAELKSLLYEFLQRNFPKKPAVNRSALLSFENIHLLNLEKIMHLIRLVGAQQLAVAFKNVDREVLRVVLHRMSTQDAKLLQQYVKSSEFGGEQQAIAAQMSILSLDFSAINSRYLFEEVGLYVFSRAFNLENRNLAKLLQYKLEVRFGALFSRFSHENMQSNTHTQVSQVQEMILNQMEHVLG